MNNTDTRNIIANAVFEALETRQMMTTVVASHGHVLDIQGNSSAANNISVETDGKNLWVNSDAGKSTPIAINKIRRININGGNAADKITVASSLKVAVQVRGGAGNDTITTGDGRDSIYGGNGDDQISAGGGHDYVEGGNGNDSIIGGAGNDVLIGNAGNDHITGGKGDDSISAGAGNDTCDGDAGDDTINLGTGNDLANGGVGSDHSFGTIKAVSTSATFAVEADGTSGDDSSGGSTDSGSGSTSNSGSNSGSTSGSGSDSGSNSGSTSGSGSSSDSSDPIAQPKALPISTVIEVGPDQAIKTLAEVPWPKSGDAPIEVLLDYSSTPYDTGRITINGVVTITSADPNHQATLNLPACFGTTSGGPDVGVQTGNPAFMVYGSLSISSIQTVGGVNSILLGSQEGSNLIAENITMTDGGGFFRGSGCDTAFFKDNDNLGIPRAYDYANFTNPAGTVTIDNSGTNLAIPQGGRFVDGQPQGETCIRIMDVNALTIYKVTTKPWFYEPGVEWKQDVQIRPTSNDITLLDDNFYMPDIGDMTWRNPAQPINQVEFINCTLAKSPHITAGAKLIEYVNTTIDGKLTNTSIKSA